MYRLNGVLNVIRINHNYRPRLSLEWQKLKPLELDTAQTAKIAELAPIVEGKPDVTKIEAINLEKLAREFRTQRINLRDRARRLRPNAAELAGRQGFSAGSAGAAG